jgi:hypothetical protein
VRRVRGSEEGVKRVRGEGKRMVRECEGERERVVRDSTTHSTTHSTAHLSSRAMSHLLLRRRCGGGCGGARDLHHTAAHERWKQGLQAAQFNQPLTVGVAVCKGMVDDFDRTTTRVPENGFNIQSYTNVKRKGVQII